MESKGKKVDKVLSAIQKFVVNKKPHDFFEWFVLVSSILHLRYFSLSYISYRRYLNKRLCDYYLVPLLSISPQVLLIWLKYHNRDTNVDGIDDEIDEISDVYFWLLIIYL